MSLTLKLNQSWKGGLDSMRDSIIANISALISGRAPIWQVEIEHRYAEGTIATLGMKNVARSQSKANSDVVLEEIRLLIRDFEPRLTEVELEMNEESTRRNQLEFRISAIMLSEFGEEAVVFDSFLDFSTSKLDVRKTNLV